jgi:hypothetical protein
VQAGAGLLSGIEGACNRVMEIKYKDSTVIGSHLIRSLRGKP